MTDTPPEETWLCQAPAARLEVAGGGVDGSSIDDVYVRYAPLLRHLALRRFRIPLEEVDSLVHDVFATYLTDPTSIRSVRPYLVGGICNASRQFWRRRNRETELADRGDEAIDEVAADERTLERIALRVDLAMTLSRIGKRCREALRLYYLEEEPTPAIAAMLETSPSNVLYLLHVCRKRARALFDAKVRCT